MKTLIDSTRLSGNFRSLIFISRFKYMKWHVKRALKRELDRSINALLKMIHCSVRQKYRGRHAVVALGNAEFSGDPTSLHKKFAQYFGKKLKSLGIPIVLVNEYRTSQVCPRCSSQVEHPKMRICHCTSCHIRYHRDKMAGENMAILGHELLAGRPRPQAYTSRHN